jgi:hypothetical protein
MTENDKMADARCQKWHVLLAKTPANYSRAGITKRQKRHFLLAKTPCQNDKGAFSSGNSRL